MEQQYDNYTDEDFSVWKTLFIRQMQQLPQVASQAYLDGVKAIGFNENEIPVFDKMNVILSEKTGWGLTVVPNIIPEKEFFPLLSNKLFSATTWLRKMSELDYLEEPDMFHDVFGHVPLLTNPTFCDFFHGLATIAMKHINNTEVLKKLGRMYWFTIEFGLINENSQPKIYGAGIVSSFGETRFSLSDEPKHLPFDVATILNTDYDNMRIQDKYFVIESYEQLFASLPEIERLVQ